MRAAGMNARGEVGDGDPVQAIAERLRTFAPDEIVISTHPEGRSNWLERGVVETARERFDVPITHVVVDLAAATGRGQGREAQLLAPRLGTLTVPGGISQSGCAEHRPT